MREDLSGYPGKNFYPGFPRIWCIRASWKWALESGSQTNSDYFRLYQLLARIGMNRPINGCTQVSWQLCVSWPGYSILTGILSAGQGRVGVEIFPLWGPVPVCTIKWTQPYIFIYIYIYIYPWAYAVGHTQNRKFANLISYSTILHNFCGKFDAKSASNWLEGSQTH